MAKKVIRIPYAAPAVKLKRVAAYARVSSGKDGMLHSLAQQVSCYSEQIQSTAGWEYAGVYADEARTGTKETRDNFQRMLEDCRAGRIDMLLVKSVSRFARNTVTLLETVRELRSLGIDVFFEEQNIHTMSAAGELMLSILASFAQAESLSNSENMKWSIRHAYAEGKLMQWHTMFGYRIVKGSISVDDREAEIVCDVFRRVIAGESYTSIARDLNERKIAANQNGVWRAQQIRNIITNEKYTGNALMQKRYVNNYLEKRRMKNNGELPMFYIEDSHPAIIDKETFVKAGTEARRRHEEYRTDRKVWEASPFSGKIRCMNCGANYKRVTNKGIPKYNCSTFQQYGKQRCDCAKAIPETVLMAQTADVLGTEVFDTGVFREQIERIEVPGPNRLVFCFYDGRRTARVWKDRLRSESWTPEMREKAREYGRKKGKKFNEAI